MNLGNFESFEIKGNKIEKHYFASSTGELLGFVELMYLSSSFQFCYIKNFEIKKENQGKGYGREMLLQLNEFLVNSNKSGVLIDNINLRKENVLATGMYERHGWVEIEDHEDWYIFNPPQNLSKEDIYDCLLKIAQGTKVTLQRQSKKPHPES